MAAQTRPWRWQFLFYPLILVGLLILPLVVTNEYVLRIMIMIWIYSVACLGYNFIMGFTGLLQFGHAAFYGIGAYTTGLLMTELGFSFWPALAAAAAVTFIFGILMGLPALRLRGDYICLVTLAFGEIFRVTMQGWQSFTHGQMGIVGIAPPSVFGFRIVSNFHFYYLGLAFVVTSFLFLTYVANSKIGRAATAIREDELAATCLGVNTAYYKVLCFSIGCTLAGVAGSFLAVFLSTIAPSNFTLGETVLMCIMVIVGGLGSLPGSILGAACLIFATEFFRQVYEYRLLIIGLIMVFVLLWHPQGIMGIRAWQRHEAEGGD